MMLNIIASYNEILCALINTLYKITTTSRINFPKIRLWKFKVFQSIENFENVLESVEIFVWKCRNHCEVNYNFLPHCQKFLRCITVLPYSAETFLSWITILSQSAENFLRWITILSHSAENFVGYPRVYPTFWTSRLIFVVKVLFSEHFDLWYLTLSAPIFENINKIKQLEASWNF